MKSQRGKLDSHANIYIIKTNLKKKSTVFWKIGKRYKILNDNVIRPILTTRLTSFIWLDMHD